MTDRPELTVPRLLQLRDGTDLIIRDCGNLQFGAVPEHSLVLSLPPRVEVEQIHQVMRELRRPLPDHTAVRMLNHCGVPVVHARGILDELLTAGVLSARPPGYPSRVHVIGTSLYTRCLLRHLRRSGVPCSGITPGTPAFGRLSGDDLVVIAGKLYPPADISYRLMELGVPHLTCGVVDAQVAVGPMVLPGVSGCLSCLDAASLAADTRWRTVRGQAAESTAPAVDHMVEYAMSMAAGMVREVMSLRVVGPDAPDWVVPDVLAARRYLDPLTFEVSVTDVPRQPGCASCAVAPGGAAAGVTVSLGDD
ncbi:TOMM precursor leader peptide-binding protein [uncultured Corynebacterium sp.]|uniref:TOMM precursor leader peptide-binding protein n=1 Tax=uncultured Corynebacterium sp. TaxID=159447 RepID=UPI0025D6F1AA|nr:TOMM precursor leader peptide-binding protein [uncultured Corynebacterium sp.]